MAFVLSPSVKPALSYIRYCGFEMSLHTSHSNVSSEARSQTFRDITWWSSRPAAAQGQQYRPVSPKGSRSYVLSSLRVKKTTPEARPSSGSESSSHRVSLASSLISWCLSFLSVKWVNISSYFVGCYEDWYVVNTWYVSVSYY